LLIEISNGKEKFSVVDDKRATAFDELFTYDAFGVLGNRGYDLYGAGFTQWLDDAIG